MELRDGQHIGVVTYAWGKWAPSLPKIFSALGIKFIEPKTKKGVK